MFYSDDPVRDWDRYCNYLDSLNNEEENDKEDYEFDSYRDAMLEQEDEGAE